MNAKTGLYPAVRSWSGGRLRILGKGPLESYCYHVMSRTWGGEVSTSELVRLCVRYFSDGAILGSKAFVEGIFEAQRDQFSPKRKQGAKQITK